MLKFHFKYKFLLLLSGLLLGLEAAAQDSAVAAPATQTVHGPEQWADSILQQMSMEQRLGQLFMVAAYSNKDEKHVKEIEKLIQEHHLGGLIFFQGGPLRQAILTNYYQSLSKVPLMIGMDAEWGLSMRLDSTLVYPKQMTLGAIQNNQVVYAMGVEIARQCKRLGVHINFAPVVDINSNPNNPVIGIRSFGENKFNVAEKGVAYMKGMQSQHVLANAKHFPGHGDTETDSHHSLPLVNHDLKRLHEVELFPFKRLIKDSIGSIMVGHLQVPAIESQANLATTLSPKAIQSLLRKELGFQGLVFTDALNMKGVSSYYKPGEVDVLALLAGNDVLLFAEDVPTAIQKIQKAIKKEEISEEEINRRVKKILLAKHWMGLSKYQAVELAHLQQDLTNSRAHAVQQACYAAALTLVSNQQKLVPAAHLDTTSIAVVSIGTEKETEFIRTCQKYTRVKSYFISKNAEEKEWLSLLDSLKKVEVVYLGLHGMNQFSRTFGITESSKKFITQLTQAKPSVLVVFGNPYSLKYFSEVPNLICAYEDLEITQSLAAQALFGAVPMTGRLPVSTGPKLSEGKGISSDLSIRRLGYAWPENVGMDSKMLSYVDSICIKTVREGATPGCQVLIAKDGYIVFEKNYGTLSGDVKAPVQSNTLYDIASVTKVAGTLQAIMFLEERGLLDIDKKASYYLSDLVGTNKEELVIRDILLHQAGLQPFLPHWRKTMRGSLYDSLFLRPSRSDSFPNEVVPGLYSLASIEDSLWKWTKESALNEPKYELDRKGRKKKKITTPEYVYSDLGFYIAKRLAETLLNQPIEDFMQDNFFSPLGLTNTMYTPLSRVPAGRIAPTEYDKYFRKTLVQGTVHDPGAALLGGVGGHAGIFSNAHDLAILFQMNLQQGAYGNYRFLLPGTLTRFTTRQTETNRRGLGWDKPADDGFGPTNFLASSSTYGHTGFTGTCAWVDPNYNLVYIFLSNRIHPDVSNNKLIRMGVRTSIQEVIYKSIQHYKVH
ncbi:MAG: serine hydrolase [Cytophagaceae bacterium]|nr:serine hydrolase [Cytophagaceae bacterium]